MNKKEFKMLDGVNPLSFSYHTKEIKITSNSEPSCEKLRSRFFPSVNPLLDKSKKKWSTFGPLKITDATTKSTKNINKNARSGSKKNLKSGLLSSSSSSSKTLRKPKIIYSNNVDSNDPIGSNKNKLNKKKSNIKLNKGKKENKKFRIACIDDVEIIDDTNKNHENTNEKNDRIDNTKKNTIKQEISEFENNNNNNNNNNFNIFDNSLYIPNNNDYVPVKIEGNEIINKEKKDNNSLNRRDQDKVDNETNMMEENIIKTQNDNDNDNDHENQKENENVITHKIKNKNKEKIKEENKKDTESNNGRGPPLSNNSSNSTIDSKKYEEEIKTLEESINIDELDNDNNDNDDDNDNDNDSKLYEEEIKKLEESINIDELDDDDDDNDNDSKLYEEEIKKLEENKLNDSMINTKDFENTTTTITNNNNNNNNNSNNKKKSLKKNNSPKNNFPSSNKSSATSRKKLDNPESSTKHNKPDKENKSLNDSKDDIKSFPSPSSSSVLANNKKKSSSNNEDNSKGKMVKSRKNIHPPTNTSMISEKEKNKNSLRKSSSTEEKKKKKNENKSKDNDNDEGVDGDGDGDVTENENITGKGNDSEDYNEFIIIPGNTLPKNNDNNEASDTIPVSEKDKNKNKVKNKGKNGEESERNSHIHDKKIKNKDFNNNNNNNCIINYGDEKDYLLPKNEKLSGKKKEFIYDTLNSLSEISDTIDTIENNLKSFNVEFIHLPNPPHPPPHHHHHHRHHQNQSQTLILPKAKSQEMIYDVSMLSSLAIRSDEDIQFTLLSITNSLREIQNQTLQDMLESSHFLKPIILSLRYIIMDYSQFLSKRSALRKPSAIRTLQSYLSIPNMVRIFKFI
ncbi:hypothetical protein LY90DRAFT_502725 [Neocallimastix californiae]|uniref:Uncharacterized protein n=1 Tax=Neocallimastix californiae TaxID=1754190 RepID=A0A1Y2ERP0_9FUNG|nr:hypothetical protein LY90DRAFT_502725 [Neocallimastix californiae]|eukprot:ORY74219.1 hypothetical protein LY90DRAFT_502725 [Neocallimastix californiae]